MKPTRAPRAGRYGCSGAPAPREGGRAEEGRDPILQEVEAGRVLKLAQELSSAVEVEAPVLLVTGRPDLTFQ